MGRGQGKVKVRKPSNSIYLDFYYKGGRPKPTIKGLSGTNKQHLRTAEAMLAQIMHEIVLDKFDFAAYFPDHPKAKQYRNASQISVEELLQDWFKVHSKGLKPDTIRGYYSAINSVLVPAFGQIAISELKPSHIKAWRSEQAKTNKSINNNLIPLRRALEDAVAEGLIEINPMVSVKNFRVDKADPDPFNYEEKKRILETAEGEIRNIFSFAFETGLRTSELIALRWSDVDFEKKRIHVRRVRTRGGERETTKTDKGRRSVLLSPTAIKVLRQQRTHRTEYDEVFLNPRTKQPWKHDGPLRKTAWKKVIEKAKVRYRCPYTTRHTYASHLLTLGADPTWLAGQMGHSDWTMLRTTYARWVPDLSVVEPTWEPVGNGSELSD